MATQSDHPPNPELEMRIEVLLLSVAVGELASLLDRQHPGLLQDLADAFHPDRVPGVLTRIADLEPRVKHPSVNEAFDSAYNAIHNIFSRYIRDD